MAAATTLLQIYARHEGRGAIKQLFPQTSLEPTLRKGLWSLINSSRKYLYRLSQKYVFQLIPRSSQVTIKINYHTGSRSDISIFMFYEAGDRSALKDVIKSMSPPQLRFSSFQNVTPPPRQTLQPPGRRDSILPDSACITGYIFRGVIPRMEGNFQHEGPSYLSLCLRLAPEVSAA